MYCSHYTVSIVRFFVHAYSCVCKSIIIYCKRTINVRRRNAADEPRFVFLRGTKRRRIDVRYYVIDNRRPAETVIVLLRYIYYIRFIPGVRITLHFKMYILGFNGIRFQSVLFN